MTQLQLFTKALNKRANEIKALQDAYFMATAMEETVTEIAEKIQRKILENGNYIICDEMWNGENHRGIENRRITEPSCTYLMDEKIFLNDFLEKCYPEYVKQGIAHPKGKEYCPEAEYHEAKIEAENQLVNIAIEIIPFPEEKKTLEKVKTHWKYRPTILDLILKLDCGKIEL